MLTRSRPRFVPYSSLVLITLLAMSCGESSPTGPSGETSFLTGTWRGSLTITPRGHPEVTGNTMWTFEVTPQTGRQNFRTTIQSDNAWLPFTTITSLVLTPSPDPPGQIGTSGTYASPRGCQGTFVSTGEAQARTIDADFTGVDCDLGDGRIGFEGRVRLTKQ
jgi:hypothetical protein